jgi:diguanylate cyclase (GGDEF)-like protein/PAS domain S-box-containing protein
VTKGKSILPGQFNSLLASHLPPKLLRERAETVERERSSRWPEELNKLSVAAANEIIHELRVHQIELEMQNDSLHLAQELLAQSQARYVALYDLAPVAYFTVDSNGVILQANLTAASLLGVSRETLLQQSLSAFVVNEDEDNFYLFRHKTLNSEKNVSTICELKIRRSDNTLFWAHLVGICVPEEDGAKVLRIVFNDVSAQHHDAEEIRRLAFFDPLTSLPNRRLLLDRLSHAMYTASRSGHYAALIFLDLDHFKLLNDSLGHGMGDLLLQQVANRLKNCVREGDSLARLGGDEFVVLLEALDQNDKNAAMQAEAIARKILYVLGKDYLLHQQTYTITASLGIIMFMHNHSEMDELYKHADIAMYQAKAAGRNTLRFFDPSMQAAAEVRSALEQDLSRGLRQNEFVQHYQIQTTSDGSVIGAEALLRWNNSQHRMVSPTQLFQLAEETRLILPIGQWVLETACAQLVKWSRQPEQSKWSMAVNVSALQLSQDDFVASITRVLTKSGANPHLLKLELTETMLANDIAGIIEKMKALKKLGVCFSLDDFGTGFSSLSYLKHLPLEQLKIDQSFVNDLLTDPSDAMICQTIITLGHNLGLNVIAEGVESKAQFDFLAGIGCDAFQGFYFGYPVEASALQLD